MVRKSDLGKFNVGILHKFDSAYNCLAATVKWEDGQMNAVQMQ